MKNSLSFGIGVTLLIQASMVLAATMSTVAPIENVARNHRDNHIREEILGLLDAEKVSDSALLELKSEPRVDVVRVLRDDLLAQPVHPSSLALRAAIFLRAVEVLPILLQLSAKSDGFEVELAIVKIAQAADAATQRSVTAGFRERLRGFLPVMKQIVLIDGLTDLSEVLGSKMYTELIGSSDYQVRIAAVRNFLALRKSLDTIEQTERFRAAFRLKPYQARLPAMEEFLRLDSLTRESLKASVPDGLCGEETRAEVKVTCKKVEEGVK